MIEECLGVLLSSCDVFKYKINLRIYKIREIVIWEKLFLIGFVDRIGNIWFICIIGFL